MASGDSFTWLPKFSEAIARIPDEGQRARMTCALVDYGVSGAEPELEYPLDMLFAALRDDIDNGKAYRAERVACGKAGGRGNKKTAKPARTAGGERNGDAGNGSEDCGKGSTNNEESLPLASESSSKGDEDGALTNTIPSHSIPSHSKEEKKSGKPDTRRTAEVEEVLRFFREATGRNFSAAESNARYVRGRLNDGHTVEELKRATLNAVRLLNGEASDGRDMRQYLRPQTVFAPEKFEGYLYADVPAPASRSAPRRNLVTGEVSGGGRGPAPGGLDAAGAIFGGGS